MLPRALNAFGLFLRPYPLGCRATAPSTPTATKGPPTLDKLPPLGGVPLDNPAAPPGGLIGAVMKRVLEGVAGRFTPMLPPSPIRR